MRHIKILLGLAAVLACSFAATDAEAAHAFSQFGRPDVQVNAGQTATFSVNALGTGANSANAVDLFFSGDLFGAGDVLTFTLGTTTHTVTGSGSGSGSVTFSPAGSLAGHNVAGTNWSVTASSGSFRVSGAQMRGGGLFMQHGNDQHVGTTSVPEPGSILIWSLFGFGALFAARRRKRAKA